MTLQDDFNVFIEKISSIDFNDIDTKYKRICKKLNQYYYKSDSDSDNSKPVSSIGRGTAIKNISDLDMLFKIPKTTFDKFNAYENQGQSQLLQEIKNVLIETYPRSYIKGDGQVVVIDFSTQHLEILPAFYIGNNTYKFPDTKDGGSWKETKPDLEIKAIKDADKANGILINLCKMIRAWKNETGVNLNGLLIDTLVYNFLKENANVKIYQANYFLLIMDFFDFLKNIDDDQEYFLAPGSKQRVYKSGKIIKKAKTTYNNLLKMKEANVYNLASVFGQWFPTLSQFSLCESVSMSDFNNTEEFIENKYIIDIQYDLSIECIVKQNGFRTTLLSKIGLLKSKKNLEFYIDKCDVPKPYEVLWKVRNVGKEAIKRDCIRGQIVRSENEERKREPAVFSGPHYVECYIIKNGTCVARDRIDVPIKIENLF